MVSLFFPKLGSECKLPCVSGSRAPHIGNHVGHVIVEIAIVYAAGNQRILVYDGILRAVHVPPSACHGGCQ